MLNIKNCIKEIKFQFFMALLPDIDRVAEKVHEDWVHNKLKQGIKSRKSPSGEEFMVEYSKLSEEAKELNRATVRVVYKSFLTLIN